MQAFTDEWLKWHSETEIREGAGEERPWVYGRKTYRQRIEEVCQWSLEHFSGDVLEIGVYGAACSVRMAPLCVKHGRKLVLVDPWEFEEGGSLDPIGLPKRVMEVMSEFGDTVQIIKKRSQDPEAIRLIQEHSYAFSFIDGSHHDKDVPIDLETVLPITTGCVAVDDWFYGVILKATQEAAPKYGWKINTHRPEFGELYLLKDSDASPYHR